MDFKVGPESSQTILGQVPSSDILRREESELYSQMSSAPSVEMASRARLEDMDFIVDVRLRPRSGLLPLRCQQLRTAGVSCHSASPFSCQER